jgi:tetratricopeptide (TPR) repeat protein
MLPFFRMLARKEFPCSQKLNWFWNKDGYALHIVGCSPEQFKGEYEILIDDETVAKRQFDSLFVHTIPLHSPSNNQEFWITFKHKTNQGNWQVTGILSYPSSNGKLLTQKELMNTPDMLYEFTVTLQEYDRPYEALWLLSECVKLDREHKGANLNLGQLLIQVGNYEAAKYHIMIAEKIDPNDSAVIDAIALISFKTKDFKLAEKALLKKIHLGLGTPNDFHQLGVILLSMGRVSEAEQMVRKAIATSQCDEAEYYFSLGYILEEMKRLDEAIENYTKSIQHDRLNIRAHLQLAKIDVEMGIEDNVDDALLKRIEPIAYNLNPEQLSELRRRLDNLKAKK